MIKEAIVKIVNKEDLTYDEAYRLRMRHSLLLFPQRVQKLKQPMKSQAVLRP